MHTAAERYRLRFSWLIGAGLIFLVLFSRARYEGTPLYEFFEWLGYVLIVLATMGRIWCAVYIGGRKDDELCTDGPYSLARNPLYLFSLIGAAGIFLAAQKLVLLLALLPFSVYYHFVIVGEEARLMEKFGSDYAGYRRRVSRILPRFGDYASRERFEVYPRVVFRSMLDASLFLWAFLVLEFLEYFKGTLGLLPDLLVLPF